MIITILLASFGLKKLTSLYWGIGLKSGFSENGYSYSLYSLEKRILIASRLFSFVKKENSLICIFLFVK